MEQVYKLYKLGRQNILADAVADSKAPVENEADGILGTETRTLLLDQS